MSASAVPAPNESQSLRTDQVSSDANSSASLPSGTGRNPSVQIRSVPTKLVGSILVFSAAEKSQSLRTDQVSSDNNSNPLQRTCSPTTNWSQSLRTDQVSSDGRRRCWQRHPDCVAIPPYRSGQFRRSGQTRFELSRFGRNPSVQIRSVPTLGVKGQESPSLPY